MSSNESSTRSLLVLSMLIASSAALPSLAHAQAPVSQGADLVPVRLVVNGDNGSPLVFGKSGQISVVIHNQGDQDFAPSSGWQVIFSMSADQNHGIAGWDSCFASGSTPSTTVEASPCYVKIPPTGTNSRVALGASPTIDLPAWIPNDPHLIGLVYVTVQITPLGCGPDTTAAAACQCTPPNCPPGEHASGPDQPNDHNNVATFQVFIRDPHVRAEPARDVPPNPTSATVNDAWRHDDVTKKCDVSPVVMTTACKALPGSLVVFDYKVYNTGNWLDSFVGTVLDTPSTTGNVNLTDRHYNWSFAPPSVTIAAGDARDVLLTVFVPATEQIDNNTNIDIIKWKLRWTSVTNNAITTEKPVCDDAATSAGVCKDPSFPPLLVTQRHGLNATTNDTIRIANISEEVTYNLTINNTGNGPDVYVLSINNDTAEINATWSPNVPWSFSVPAFTKVVKEMKFQPPTDAVKGVHHFDVTLQSQDDPDGTTRQTLHLGADVQQKWLGCTPSGSCLTGAFDTSIVRLVPADTASYVLRVNNLGNGPDNATIDLQNVPFQWTAQLSSRVAQMPPFGSATVYLNVTPPPNTPENTAAAFFLNVTSQGPIDKSPEQRSHFTARADMTVIRGPNLDVQTNPPKAFVDPGASADYIVAVENTGNVRDNYTVTVERAQDQLSWTASVDPAFLVLDPVQTGILHVTLKAPSTGAVGETTKIFVTVKSTVDQARVKQTTLEGEVSGPDLSLDNIFLNSTTPYTGDPLELSITLSNAGNKVPTKNVTLKTYFIQDGVPHPIGERTFLPNELPGGRKLTTVIGWDTGLVSGTGTIVARLDEANDIAEIDETNNELSKPLVIRTFDIRVVAAEGLSGRPGERVSYSQTPNVFQVQYNGNQPVENVTVLVESDNGWGRAELGLGLPRGAIIPVLVDIAIPDHPGVATDTLRLTVIPALRPNALVTATTLTTVIDEDPPQILDVTATPNVKLAQETTISADVTDATGLSSVRAFVVTPANETLSIPLEHHDGDTWSHAQAFPGAGTYRVFVEAVDNSVNANKNTSRGTLVTFTVTPGSAPVITLAPGQPTTIRTGTPVQLSITDPLGVGDATYTIRGVTFPLPRPFVIDTSQFASGVIDVTVTASNIYGVTSTAKLQLTIDNAAPGIHKVTLDPPSPKANQDATLRVETDAKVSNVTVVIKKDGIVLDTRPLARTSAGVFQLLLNPAQGDYTLDVSARDDAGNTKLDEGAVHFTAKPASPFSVPAPGAATAIAAVAAVAIAMAGARRRQRR